MTTHAIGSSSAELSIKLLKNSLYYFYKILHSQSTPKGAPACAMTSKSYDCDLGSLKRPNDNEAGNLFCNVSSRVRFLYRTCGCFFHSYLARSVLLSTRVYFAEIIGFVERQSLPPGMLGAGVCSSGGVTAGHMLHRVTNNIRGVKSGNIHKN